MYVCMMPCFIWPKKQKICSRGLYLMQNWKEFKGEWKNIQDTFTPNTSTATKWCQPSPSWVFTLIQLQLCEVELTGLTDESYSSTGTSAASITTCGQQACLRGAVQVMQHRVWPLKDTSVVPTCLRLPHPASWQGCPKDRECLLR